MITEEVKERLIADYPKFEDMTRKFYKKEMSIADYKGQSGAYGSYAERGAATGMSRWRFNGGRMTREHTHQTRTNAVLSRYYPQIQSYTYSFHNRSMLTNAWTRWGNYFTALQGML